MFVSTSAAAQEFSFDAGAMGKILAGTRALKIKHQGRPMPPMVSDYEARHISFSLRSNGSSREGAKAAIEPPSDPARVAFSIGVLRDPAASPGAKLDAMHEFLDELIHSLDRYEYIHYDITMATKKQNVAIRVAPELIQELDKIGKVVNRSRAWLGEDALRHYVELQRWHLSEIAAGISDIKSGRVIPNSKVEAWLNSWGKPDEKSAPFE